MWLAAAQLVKESMIVRFDLAPVSLVFRELCPQYVQVYYLEGSAYTTFAQCGSRIRVWVLSRSQVAHDLTAMLISVPNVLQQMGLFALLCWIEAGMSGLVVLLHFATDFALKEHKHPVVHFLLQ